MNDLDCSASPQNKLNLERAGLEPLQRYYGVWSRDSSVRIGLGCELHDRGSGI
jgi:hypothetical protein